MASETGLRRTLRIRNFKDVCNSPAALAANAGDINEPGKKCRPRARPFAAGNFRLKRIELRSLCAPTFPGGS